MSTAILQLPVDLDLHEGEHFSFEIEGFAHDGKLVVNRIVSHEPTVQDAENAVDSFLRFCEEHNSGSLTGATDEDLKVLQLEHLQEKHLK